MSVTIGSRIGPYELTARLGEGGNGRGVSRARLQAIGEARIVLERVIARPEQAPGSESTAPIEAAQPQWRRALPWTVAFATLLALALAQWITPRTAPPPAPVRITAEIGADASLLSTYGANALLSPDGTTLALVAYPAGGSRSQIYVRRLDQLKATLLAGTEDAHDTFFSPDGQWIAFFADGKLKKISVTGGAAVTLADAPNDRGGAWGEDGTIVFAPDNIVGTRLMRVSSAGGKPEPLTSLAEGEAVQRWPQVLPGGGAILFTSSINQGSWEDADIVVVRLATGERKTVHRGGHYGRYLKSGHLVYVHNATLFAAPFDLERLEVSGQPAPVIEGVTSGATNGGAQYTVSDSGTLVYLPGQSIGNVRPNPLAAA
jgi:serine/threonine-protein kinase